LSRSRKGGRLTIVDRKLARWRDDLDPIAVFEAVGWPAAA
jgi:hypothetical protein